MIFIIDLINDSVVLKNMEDFNEITPEEYYERDGAGCLHTLIGNFIMDYEKLKKMYEGDYDFTDNELLILLDQLNYIDNKWLMDMIIFSKYKKSKIIEDNLNEDLSKIYTKSIVDEDIFREFIKRKNISILKWLHK